MELLNRYSFLKPLKTKSQSKAIDYLTYQITNAIIIIYISTSALVILVGNFGNSEATVYSHSSIHEKFLIYPMIVYQFYQAILFFACPLPEFGSYSMLLHHVVTFLVGVFGIIPQPYLQSYSLFFFGIAELSTIPLQVVDIFKNFKHTQWATEFQDVKVFFQFLFALLFLIIRCIIWPSVSFVFWRDALMLLSKGKAHNTLIVVFSLCANVFLTSLQIYWGALICKKISRYTFDGRTERNNIHAYTHVYSHTETDDIKIKRFPVSVLVGKVQRKQKEQLNHRKSRVEKETNRSDADQNEELKKNV